MEAGGGDSWPPDDVGHSSHRVLGPKAHAMDDSYPPDVDDDGEAEFWSMDKVDYVAAAKRVIGI